MMIATNPPIDRACRQLLDTFFAKYPNGRLSAAAKVVLARLLAKRIPLRGKPGGWAAGIVYAISRIGVGVPGVLNRDLEEAFGVTMSTIYKRAAKVRELLGL